MADITVQTASPAGLINPTFAAAAVGGDTFTNDGKTIFIIKNGGGSPVTPTFDSLLNCDQGVDHNVGTAIPTAQDGYFGPFPPSRFNNGSGKVSVTYSGVTSVTVAAVKAPF